jgi:hypothetical protein
LVGEEASEAGSTAPLLDDVDVEAGDAPAGEKACGIKGPADEERRTEGTDPKWLGWRREAAGTGGERTRGGGEVSPPQSPEPILASFVIPVQGSFHLVFLPTMAS